MLAPRDEARDEYQIMVAGPFDAEVAAVPLSVQPQPAVRVLRRQHLTGLVVHLLAGGASVGESVAWCEGDHDELSR